MAQAFIGEIRYFGFTFAPVGWAMCAGQLLPIAQNAALFSLLGTNYGGNGTTTFALPDLRGRAPINQGSGPGLASYVVGQLGGTENVTLTVNQMPAHTHQVAVSSSPATDDDPQGTILAGGLAYAPATDGNTSLAPPATMGGSQPFSILQPYLTVTACIALVGIFPTRN